jgi:hypothetical protein
MMIVVLPFDLRLWTGVDESKISDAEAYLRFVDRRDLVSKLDQHLTKSAISQCHLRIPLTQRLYEQLSNTPPWSEIRRGSHLYRLKRTILALLRNKRGAAGLTLYMDVSGVEHLYTWERPDNFFPVSLSAMRESWIEMVGVCAFETTISARDFDQPIPLLGGSVVTTFSGTSEAQITRRPLVRMPTEAEAQPIPLLYQSDIWTWKRLIRRYIWKDERLPLGPIGYAPSPDWQPGDRPRRYHNAYRDALGGLWEWEGGRARDTHNPFGGHWNVQLPDASVKRQWVQWIETCSGQQICTRPALISHINVEPNGSIGDKTFQWCD